MDNQRIARELLKVAKELSAKSKWSEISDANGVSVFKGIFNSVQIWGPYDDDKDAIKKLEDDYKEEIQNILKNNKGLYNFCSISDVTFSKWKTEKDSNSTDEEFVVSFEIRVEFKRKDDIPKEIKELQEKIENRKKILENLCGSTDFK